jgi:hypothetical protein
MTVAGPEIGYNRLSWPARFLGLFERGKLLELMIEAV